MLTRLGTEECTEYCPSGFYTVPDYLAGVGIKCVPCPLHYA